MQNPGTPLRAEQLILAQMRPARHPGTILKQLLDERGESPATFAARCKMTFAEKRVLGLLRREYSVSREIAVGLASAFTEAPWDSPTHWLQLQDDYASKRLVDAPVRPRAVRAEPGRKIDVETREKVLELVGQGLSSEEAGEIVGLKKMSVAGIRSADTKGLYS